MANTNTSTPTTSGSSENSQSGLGKTIINDGVVSKIAGIAAREAHGVYALGGGAARAIGAIRDAMNATDQTQGINVEVGETQVAVDVTIVADYPMPLQDVADAVRTDVIRAIETIAGMEVTEVNVTVNDVHLPSDETHDENKEARVQ